MEKKALDLKIPNMCLPSKFEVSKIELWSLEEKNLSFTLAAPTPMVRTDSFFKYLFPRLGSLLSQGLKAQTVPSARKMHNFDEVWPA